MHRNQPVMAQALLYSGLLAFLFFLISSTQAATRDVCPSGCTYSTIQAALDAAERGDTIDIGSGLYEENLTTPWGNEFDPFSLTINGAGSEATVIDGGANGTVLSVGYYSDMTITGLTLKNGLSVGCGGGMTSVASNVTLTDVVVSQNEAVGGGGICFLNDPFFTLSSVQLTLTDSEVSQNVATGGFGTGYGGGIQMGQDTQLVALRVVVSGNLSGGDGGGIGAVGTFSPLGTQVRIQDSLIAGNESPLSGGGLWGEDATIEVIDSRVIDNKARVGGGISNDGSSYGIGYLIVEGSTIANNETNNSGAIFHRGGGGIWSGEPIWTTTVDAWTVTQISNSTISGNRVLEGVGGGVAVAGGLAQLTIVNSTVSNNESSEGGAIEVYDVGGPGDVFGPPASFHSLSLADNDSVGLRTNDRVSMTASIIANNSGADCVLDPTPRLNPPPTEILSGGGNLGSDTSCGLDPTDDVSEVDPLLNALADNGGPTLTRSLQPGSPARGLADCGGAFPVDQRGAPRPGVGVAVCDSGAYQSGAPALGPLPVEVAFGTVVLGESGQQILTLTNEGNASFEVTALTLSSGPFSLVTLPPLIVQATESVDIEIQFSPVIESLYWENLTIEVRDPATGAIIDTPVLLLSGRGASETTVLLEEIDEILAVIDGAGPGQSADARKDALISLIDAANDLIVDQRYEAACRTLASAGLRVDDDDSPPDFVSGEAAATLAGLIADLRDALNCSMLN